MAVVDTPELELFRQTSKSFLAKEMSIEKVRALHAEGRAFDPEWWRRAVELGWTSLLVPEKMGGGSVSGNGIADLASVATAMGTTVAAGPLLPVSVVLTALVEADDDVDRQGLVDELVAGEAVATWAVYEPGSGWNPLQANVTATSTASGYRLDGVKDRVEFAAQSQYLLVTATGEDGLSQFVVRTDAPGVTIAPTGGIDMTRTFAQVTFEGVELDGAARVGTPTGTPASIALQSQVALVLQCAESVGALVRVLDFTLEWANDRYSFGRPLSSYQALKHRFADMKIWLEASKATTAAAVAAVAARSEAAEMCARVAKSFVGERSTVMVHECVQLHGGIGVTWEHDLHLYIRRLTVNRNMYGSPEEQNLSIYALER